MWYSSFDNSLIATPVFYRVRNTTYTYESRGLQKLNCDRVITTEVGITETEMAQFFFVSEILILYEGSELTHLASLFSFIICLKNHNLLCNSQK